MGTDHHIETDTVSAQTAVADSPAPRDWTMGDRFFPPTSQELDAVMGKLNIPPVTQTLIHGIILGTKQRALCKTLECSIKDFRIRKVALGLQFRIPALRTKLWSQLLWTKMLEQAEKTK